MGTAAASVERFDLSGRLGQFARTPSGGLKIPGWISRTGVQTYTDAEGRVVRELRPAAEVFDETSYRSFENAPVTVGHPEELVSPGSWKGLAVGMVRNVRPDGDRLAADLVVEDAETIAAIEAGELVETSAGYVAGIEGIGGSADGEPYDAVQRQIRGNHVALGPSGWGRAGPSVRLRVDAAHQVIESAPTAPTERNDSMSQKRTVKVDGYEFEAGSESHLAAVERERGKLTAELDAATKRADAAETKAKDLGAELEKAKADAKNVDIGALVDARLALIDQARKLLGDGYEHQGKTDREVMVDALAKAGTKIAEDASEDFVRGAFAAAAGAATKDAGDMPDDEDAPPADEPDGDETSMDSRGFTRTPRKDVSKPYRVPSLADKCRPQA